MTEHGDGYVPRVLNPTRFDSLPYDGPAKDWAAPAFVRKWGVDGVTKIESDSVDITVRYAADALAERLAEAHELGHAARVRTMPQSEINAIDRWRCEVDAWMSAKHDLGRDMTYLEGTMVLDALNTYRRALKPTDEQWELVRQVVEGWNEDSNKLAEYVPLEPDPDTTPPDCFGEPLPSVGEPDEWEQQDNGESPNGDEPEQGNGPPEERGEEQEAPEDPREGYKFSAKKRWQNKANQPGKDAAKMYRQGDEVYRERDVWLASPEGIAYTKQGRKVLDAYLLGRMWPNDNLPPVTEAILKGGE